MKSKALEENFRESFTGNIVNSFGISQLMMNDLIAPTYFRSHIYIISTEQSYLCNGISSPWPELIEKWLAGLGPGHFLEN